MLFRSADYGTETASSGQTPVRTLELATFNGSASQAQDLAQYYLAQYETPQVVIQELTCKSEAQAVWALDLGDTWWNIIGQRTNVTFRGTDYYMTIIGASFYASPQGSSFTYKVASAEFTPFFILDSAEYGVLDTNRLSW